LAAISGGVKLYSRSCIIIIIYPALSAAIGGRDGVDASRCIQMWRVATFLFGKHHQVWFLGGGVDSIGSLLLISYSFLMHLDAFEGYKSYLSGTGFTSSICSVPVEKFDFEDFMYSIGDVD
jgi:hypothetical protein